MKSSSTEIESVRFGPLLEMTMEWSIIPSVSLEPSRIRDIGSMPANYVEQRIGGFYVLDSPVSLDSIVFPFRDGSPPEIIQRSYPTQTLEEVYGAIAFYLANRSRIDEYLIESESEFKAMAEDSCRKNADLYAKLEQAREELLTRKS